MYLQNRDSHSEITKNNIDSSRYYVSYPENVCSIHTISYSVIGHAVYSVTVLFDQVV